MKQTSEELALVKRHVEIPFLMDTIEEDKKRISSSTLKMKAAYVDHLSTIQRRITVEMVDLKKTLKQNDIKIIQQYRSTESLTIDYSTRGYEHKMTLIWSKVMVDITLILTEYMHVDITASR
ncbi:MULTISPECIES: hypothetical protein [Paenibacillus]|uniref:hypothetical protein n=1 Tax=Paenibacillus TaxID=44249 RepID=UPI000466F591|nr:MULTISPECIES: hypothetical protein [Paenibacillus]KGP78104.1 hypothetical protein P364_0130075 [Paenibacillus sp. MAEPY2]KGP89374.1 hypothetical protein P363_0101575 [Paenibacillus sp. MAEPY1]OZQ71075.1 hypothetical protein CA599_11110 [Paenibacillus taichungensis]